MSFKSRIGQLAPMVDFSVSNVTIELDHEQIEKILEDFEDTESESEMMSDDESPNPLQMFAEVAGKVAREEGLPY
ncbi:Protein CBG25698 [Caenorhabditis briggsae]|uniref:Protein CBG25698 n=1 Tax=Caenorhabditis briggsae TaxID=6238 RepID=B6IGW1_CAEBR|nr:Protein CBG25698 [Caenorhabditis briggsae]CAR99141.1 Protein CBG25698 [Caenorhabditis briggsae]